MTTHPKIRRSSSVKLGAALLATGLVSLTGSSVDPASAIIYGREIQMRTVNNSPTHISAAFCPRGHVSPAYNFGQRQDPCDRIIETHHPAPDGGRYTYTANPFGEIIRAPGYETLYFHVENPSVGKPQIVVNRSKYSLVEGELKTVHPSGATIRLHREGDRDSFKQMTIEIIRMKKS